MQTCLSGMDELVRAHAPALLARALFLTRNGDDAWDLLQDTLLRALTRPPPALPDERLRAWLFAVMSHLHVDRCRAGRRRRTVIWDPVLATEPAVEEAPLPSWESIDTGQVRACVDLLAPRLREPYRLQTEEGLSLREIGLRLGLPLPTVGTRLHRARRKLRALLTRKAGAVGASAPALT